MSAAPSTLDKEIQKYCYFVLSISILRFANKKKIQYFKLKPQMIGGIRNNSKE